MGKNKEELAVKKGDKKNGIVGVPPSRMLSPMRTWEREMNRLFEDFPFGGWPRLRALEAAGFPRDLRMTAPSVDVYEEKNDLVVKAEMPGMAKEDIEITLSDSHLTLKGEKKKEEEVKEKDYYRCEREYGSFLRSVELPAEVKSEGAKATFKDGVLEVRLAKSTEPAKKEIKVEIR